MLVLVRQLLLISDKLAAAGPACGKLNHLISVSLSLSLSLAAYRGGKTEMWPG